MIFEQLFVYGGVFALVVLLQSTALFLCMVYKKDNSLIDIAYGPLFFTSACITLILLNQYHPLSLFITVLIGIWALRLSYRIGKKNWGKGEDVRYATWRSEWMKRGMLYFIIRSYAQVNVLQGFFIVLIAMPFIVSLTAAQLSWTFVLYGALITVLGLTVETVADAQIDAFVRGKKTGTIIEPFLAKGLFRYSRRPNYFGETLVWWGLAIMVLPLPYGYLALIGPLTITFVVTKITGPMLEEIFIKKYGEAYVAYMQRTSYFIPLPPKKDLAIKG